MEVFDQPYHGPTRIRHGGADIWEVEEIWHKRPLSDMTTDKALIASLPQWMFPDFIDAHWNFDIVTRCWIVIVDGRVIVVDPCTGNGRNFPDFEPAHMLDTPFIERFAATGFRPEDVDFVFCTHLHMDHCGWNTVLRDGRYVPTFPNARYVMVKREIDRWDPQPVASYEYDLEICDLCVRECPIENAISLEPVSGAGDETRFRPVVHDACVGCGTCEMMCPADPAAIVIDTELALAREA